MRRSLVTLLFLLTTSAWSANIPTISDVSQVGGGGLSGGVTDGCLVIPNASTLKNVVVLVSNYQSAGANARLAFTKMSGGDGSTGYGGLYQAPSGKTFVATCIWYGDTTGAALRKLIFGYATATFTNATTSATSGEVTYSTVAADDTTGTMLPIGSATSLTKQPFMLTFKALSFPFRMSAGIFNGPVYLIGYEI